MNGGRPREPVAGVATAGAVVDRADMGLFREVQQFLANPNVALVLLAPALLGLLFELASPDVGVDATNRQGTVLVFPVPVEMLQLARGARDDTSHPVRGGAAWK
ncbi:MAG: hypothetical protein ACODAF_06095 [Actinomycetota bacterium]